MRVAEVNGKITEAWPMATSTSTSTSRLQTVAYRSENVERRVDRRSFVRAKPKLVTSYLVVAVRYRVLVLLECQA